MSRQASKGDEYSAKSVLTHRLGCRATPGGWQWRLYWSEGGSELTLYQSDEGPQEARDIEEALGWIGGDQRVLLNPGTIKYVNALDDQTRETLLDELAADVLGPEPFRYSDEEADGDE